MTFRADWHERGSWRKPRTDVMRPSNDFSYRRPAGAEKKMRKNRYVAKETKKQSHEMFRNLQNEYIHNYNLFKYKKRGEACLDQ